MSRKAKGRRPVFFDDPDNDRLLAMLMALAGEVSVLHDRLDTVERLAQAKGLLTHEEVDAYVPGTAVAEAREAWRAEYLARLLRIVHHERESVDRRETPESYDAAVTAVAPQPA